MAAMETPQALLDALSDDGFDDDDCCELVGQLCTHACVCRTRADTPSGAFRDFVTATSHMTRDDLRPLVANKDVTPAACEALFDLIMEGV